MKILYVIDRPNLYGSEMHTLEIIKHFKKDSDVFLLSLWGGPLLERVEKLGVKTKVIKSGWRKILFNRHLIKEFVKAYQPDLIHAHQPKAIFAMALVGWILKIPTVITVHSKPIDNALLRSGIKFYLVYLFHWIVNYKAQLFAKKIIFVSRDMMRRTHFKKKSLVIHNWLSPRIGNPEISTKRLIDHGKKIKFVSVGSVTSAKGYDELIEFVSKLKDELNFNVKILGDGDKDYIKSLKEKASDLGVSEKINFLGFQHNVGYYLKESDVFIMFSKSESFGMSYVEAMAYGLPIIARDLAVLHEIIPEGNCVSDDLESCRKMLISLLKDDAKYQELSNRNKNWVKKRFDYENNMKKLEDVYKSILK